jgi:hypothetical protein
VKLHRKESIVELIVVLSTLILIGLSGALAGADSRDGLDWKRRKP